MVTGDNKTTAISIAKRCHILPEDYEEDENDDTVLLGSQFRERVGFLVKESEEG